MGLAIISGVSMFIGAVLGYMVGTAVEARAGLIREAKHVAAERDKEK